MRERRTRLAGWWWMLPVLVFPAFLAYHAARRSYEWRADRQSVGWTEDPEALITGLVRITRACDTPREWGWWVGLALSEPSTMDRVRAVARQANIGDRRLRELLETAEQPAGDGYLTGCDGPAEAPAT